MHYFHSQESVSTKISQIVQYSTDLNNGFVSILRRINDNLSKITTYYYILKRINTMIQFTSPPL